jgi:excisionase family DNA binding protein
VIGQHLKTTELAERLSLNPETLRRAAARGELKPVRIGRDLIWPEEEVARWLQGKTVDNSRVVPLKREDRASTESKRRSA